MGNKFISGKLKLLILLFSFGCSTNLHLILTDKTKESYDLNINRISEISNTGNLPKIIISTVNNQNLMITSEDDYSDFFNNIPSIINNSYFLMTDEIPEFIKTIKSIIEEYDKEYSKKTTRVLKYKTSILTGTKISRIDFFTNFATSNQYDENLVLLNLEFIKSSKTLFSDGIFMTFQINNKNIWINKSDLEILFKDLNNVYAIINKK